MMEKWSFVQLPNFTSCDSSPHTMHKISLWYKCSTTNLTKLTRTSKSLKKETIFIGITSILYYLIPNILQFFIFKISITFTIFNSKTFQYQHSVIFGEVTADCNFVITLPEQFPHCGIFAALHSCSWFSSPGKSSLGDSHKK